MAQDVIVSERRFQYEADVKQDPLNYDSWFDYVRLEESAGQPERVHARCPLPPDIPPCCFLNPVMRFSHISMPDTPLCREAGLHMQPLVLHALSMGAVAASKGVLILLSRGCLTCACCGKAVWEVRQEIQQGGGM